MWIIAFLSVTALAIFIERLVYLSCDSRDISKLLYVIKSLDQITWEKLYESACKKLDEKSRIFSIFKTINANYKTTSPKLLKDILLQQQEFVASDWERGINIIAVVSKLSPLLGLLGTVLGMIEVFKKLPSEGIGNYAVLSGGIWKALLTTAYGLSVAIFVVVLYTIITAKIDKMTDDLNYLCHLVWQLSVGRDSDEE